MNKAELIATMAETSGVSKKDTELVLNAFIDTVQKTLKQDGKVQIPSFGSFEVRERAARSGRNPLTGEAIEIAAAKVPALGRCPRGGAFCSGNSNTSILQLPIWKSNAIKFIQGIFRRNRLIMSLIPLLQLPIRKGCHFV